MPALQKLCRFLRSDAGPTAIEYAMVLALIVLICTAAVRSVGAEVLTVMTRSADSVAGYLDAAVTRNK